MARLQLVFNSWHERAVRTIADQTQSSVVDVLRRMVDVTAGDPVLLGRLFPLASGSLYVPAEENGN